MAESDTILQLGIEAAREGNREEARNLFGLLTRQEPDNAQAWLWLAGVADGPEQRRAALERAVELDPTNEMAIKGLQAMGVNPTVKLDDAVVPDTPVAAAPPERPMTDEERYAAELDSAFDDYDALPRSETPRRDVEDTAAMAGAAAGAVAADRMTSSGRTARERSAARRASTPVRSGDDDDDDYMAPPASRPNNLLWLLIGLIALLLVGYLAYRFLFSGPQTTADNPTAVAETTTAAGGGTGEGGTPVATPEGGIGGTGGITDTTGLTPTTALSETTGLTPTVTTEQPQPQPQPQPGGPEPVPAAAANPNAQPVSVGTQLSANGWSFT